MKRVFSVLLTLCLMVTFTACGGEETPAPAPEEPAGIALPFGLSFGMTETDFAAKLTAAGLTAPAVEPASNNTGYFSDGVELPLEDPTVWEFLGSDTLKTVASKDLPATDPLYKHKAIGFAISSPTLYASFNQDKELYEIYVGWNFINDEFAQMVFSDVAETYNAFFGTDGKVDAVTGNWENEKYGVSFQNTDDITYLLVIHDKAHNLDAWLAN